MRGRAGTVMTLALLVLLALAAPAVATYPGRNGVLGFTSLDAGGVGGTSTVAPDGSDGRLLSDEHYGTVSWSPDGEIIVTAGYGPARYSYPYRGIYFLSRTGQDLAAIPEDWRNSGGFHGPSWGPSGRAIAYRELHNGCPVMTVELALVGGRLERSNERVVHNPGGDCSGYDAAWSPTGELIAFDVYSGPGRGLYVVAPDGTGLRRIADRGAAPDWSPDGSRIVYTDCESLTFGEVPPPCGITTVRPDGTDARRLTSVPRVQCYVALCAYEGDPAWSPDGTRIAFVRVSSLGHADEIWTVDPETGSQLPLTRLRGTGDPRTRLGGSLGWQPRR